MASKRKILTLDERIKVIELCKTKSAHKVAEELGVGKTLIQSILKCKIEQISDWTKSRNDFTIKKKVSMRLDIPKLFGLLMEVEDGFNELAVAAHNKQSDIRHFLKTSWCAKLFS